MLNRRVEELHYHRILREIRKDKRAHKFRSRGRHHHAHFSAELDEFAHQERSFIRRYTSADADEYFFSFEHGMRVIKKPLSVAQWLYLNAIQRFIRLYDPAGGR